MSKIFPLIHFDYGYLEALKEIRYPRSVYQSVQIQHSEQLGAGARSIQQNTGIAKCKASKQPCTNQWAMSRWVATIRVQLLKCRIVLFLRDFKNLLNGFSYGKSIFPPIETSRQVTACQVVLQKRKELLLLFTKNLRFGNGKKNPRAAVIKPVWTKPEKRRASVCSDKKLSDMFCIDWLWETANRNIPFWLPRHNKTFYFIISSPLDKIRWSCQTVLFMNKTSALHHKFTDNNAQILFVWRLLSRQRWHQIKYWCWAFLW